MVLRDIIDEYNTLKNQLIGHEYYFSKGTKIMDQYIQNICAVKNFDFNSDEINLDDYFLKIEKDLFTGISELFFSAQSISYMLGQLSHFHFNTNLNSKIHIFAKVFDTFVLTTRSILEEKMFNPKASYDVANFLQVLKGLCDSYYELYDIPDFLKEIEEQLFEPLPEENDLDNLVNFELRSFKSNYDLSSFAQDLNLLAKFITQAQSILNSSTPLYLRKIESGSLKITWSGGEVEISCISEIINAIINGIRTLAFIPSEIKIKQQEINKLELENEALAIENKSKKLAIVNSQIGVISEKLGLDKNNPENVEKIQQLCRPLIGYLENNPVGCINDQKYNIDSSVKYLILKEKEKE